MSASSNRKQWFEFAAVAIAVVAAAFLFFEIIRSLLPNAVQLDRSSMHGTLLIAAAIGASLFCCGIGAASVSSVRLLIALRQGNDSRVRTIAKEHLRDTSMIVVGFVLFVCALYFLL